MKSKTQLGTKMDVQTIGIIAGVVAFVAIVLYVWERRSKHQPVEMTDAAKLAIGASGIAGGVAYAVGGVEDVQQSVEAVTSAVQDMFVGKPEF
jgi:hypothetical protein